jgi:hypothetical protein
VRPALRPEGDGKFVAVDLDIGEYEVDEDDRGGHPAACAPAGGQGLARAGGPAGGVSDQVRSRRRRLGPQVSLALGHGRRSSVQGQETEA